MAAASAELAHAAPNSPTPDGISTTTQTGLTAYHGYKQPEHLDSILEGLRPVGSAGNNDPNWKGLYLAESINHAAGYSINDDATQAGGVVEVTLPHEVTVAEVTLAQREGEAEETYLARQLTFIKEKLDVKPGEQLMDTLGQRNTVIKMNDGTGRNEIIVPWNMAKDGKATSALKFRAGLKGVADASVYAAQAESCGTGGTRVRRSASWCQAVDWQQVKEKAKATVKKVTEDKAHMDSLPERSRTGLSRPEAVAVAERTHAKVREVSGTHVAAGAFGVGTWAYGMARTFSDKNATPLDKAAATTAIVPGVGQALGIADGVQNHDPEAIAVNAVALAALVASQAVPVVGEIVDVALLADAVVETLIDIFERAKADPPPPPSLDKGALPILPVPKADLPCSIWWFTMDVLWDTSVKVPGKTQTVVRERGGKEYTYPASDGKSPGWTVTRNRGDERTFDVFYRLTTDQGKVLESKKRAVVKASSDGFQCQTLIWEEDWNR
ncbi:hypothetical protein ACFP1Z_09985 [Streptomyces gamaensis]|uniref:Diphtheria toxin catalytic domain-containing protein n=1 Tax=Streptomyces gamaensis TaxID=1763542 RepID=A0ABW0Z0L3_9ACTN